jgi:pectinesterase
MWFKPGEEPSVPDGRQDNTHYNVYGAHVVAKLLADALCEEIPLLKKYRCEADYTVDAKGRGDFMSLQQAIDTIQSRRQQTATVQILGGGWQKPQLPRKSKIQFIMRENAKWQAQGK